MIHHNMAAETYHAYKAIGSTTAKAGLVSRQLLRDTMDGIIKFSSPSLKFGTLAHRLVLEPEKFTEQAVGHGPINEKTGQPYGQETKVFAQWQAENPDKIVVDATALRMLGRMPAPVREALAGGVSEASAFASLGKVSAKCRPDHLRGTVIRDLKTINDIDLIPKHIVRYKYWFSAAWYRAVMRAETGESHDFTLIFAESKPPHRWRIVELDASYRMHGADAVKRIVSMIEESTASGDWSDQGEIEQMESLPEYLYDDEEESEE